MTGSVPARGPIGLVVLGSIATGLALGAVLTLGAFGGGEEAAITGSALISLGAGFAGLTLGSRLLTTEPQSWALAPGLASALAGLCVLALSPGDRVLHLAGWIWPLLLAALVGWSFRGARRSLRHWSRRAVLYPALAVLLLVSVGGAVQTMFEATASAGPSVGHS